MPWSTDEDAQRFVEATSAVIHYVTLPVLARWRSIGLHAGLPEAAARLANELGELQRLWNDPRSGEFAALLALDILRSSPHGRARENAAYSIASMGKTVLAEQAGKEARPWRGAAKLPPIAVDRNMGPSSAEVQRSLDAFARWFRTREAGFEAGSAKEQPAWAELRALLEASGR